MENEQNKGEDQGQVQTQVKQEQAPAPKQEEQKPDGVVLSPEQYNAVLDALAELEELKSTRAKAQPKGDVDELADEVRPQRGQKPQQRDPESMTQSELIQHVMDQVALNVAQPLLVKLESMRLDREIERITKGDDNHEFFDYKNEIYEIASRNPNLSLKEAFKLAKEQRTEAKPRIDDRQKKSELIHTLPSRATFQSEKPGVSRKSTDQPEPETRAEAANLAMEEMRKKGYKI